ncbi:CocE/NonD family hydrolase [Streptomyces coeruleorubidus]
MDTDFHLRADGRLTPEPPSAAEQPEEFTYDPMDPVPTTGGALLLTDDFRPGPFDQAAVEAREEVLVFTNEPLTEDVEVTGRVRAVLFAATDGPSTDWVARLCDVDENGVSRNVTDGIVRVREAIPGEAAEHVVDLWSTSVVFRAGHRIRVQVTYSRASARDAVAEWTQGAIPVTAVAAFNDLIALAVLASCRTQHIDVPDDLALIGVDDLPVSSLAVPSLTTIGMDLTAAAGNLTAAILTAVGAPAPVATTQPRRRRWWRRAPAGYNFPVLKSALLLRTAESMLQFSGWTLSQRLPLPSSLPNWSSRRNHSSALLILLGWISSSRA